jgi:succinate dehydrogenase / fumarate reductase, cytochrome b subunit
MQLFTSTVGRKILMAISGQIMVLFVVVHMLGNSTIYFPGGLNAYAEHLHALPPLVWAFRLVMLTMVLVHIVYGIQLTLENRAANPGAYAVNNKLKVSFASENMIWTGLLMALFIIYHLTHFTARLWSDVASFKAQVPGNVYGMVVSSFSRGGITFIYVASMIVLCLHLFHGIQSFFQTMGWNNDCTMPCISKAGKVAAVILLIGYSIIPIFIIARILT